MSASNESNSDPTEPVVRGRDFSMRATRKQLKKGDLKASSRLRLQSNFMSFRFEIEAHDGNARAGRFFTPHGVVQTPVFMPVGTLGTVKAVAQDVLEELGVEILLNNTYHLYLRPGVEMVRSLGGVQRFMAWDKPILTD